MTNGKPWLDSHGKPVEFRVGRREPDPSWLLKISPGWTIVFRHESLEEIGRYLTERAVDLSSVILVDQWPWRSLSAAMAEQASQRLAPTEKTA